MWASFSTQLPRERTCDRKTKFSAEFAARRAGMHKLAEFPAEYPLGKLYPYPCAFCRGWHLTKNGQGLNSGTVAITASQMWEGVL